MQEYKGKKFEPKIYCEFVKIFGEFQADYLNIGSESADLIERIIEAFKADNPKFKEKYFREQLNIVREAKRAQIEAQFPNAEESDGQPTEQKEIEDLEGIESEIYSESDE